MERPDARVRRLAAIAAALRPSLAAPAGSDARKLGADGEPVQRAVPLTKDDDPEGADRVGLTQAEVEYFKANGFLVKRDLLPKDVLRPQVDRIWSTLAAEQPSVSRADSAALVDPHSHWTETQGPSSTEDGRPSARNWPMSFTGAGDWNWHALGSDPAWLAATSAHPNTLHVVEALLGGPIKLPTRNRGIYFMFPKSEPGGLSPHHDWHPFDLGGMALISRVEPYSGGTTLWPCSHSRLQALLPNEQGCGFYPNDDYVAERDDIIANCQPIELTGSAGDFLFFHPCMIHSRGLNSAAHGSGMPRIASPQDFQRCRPRSNLMWQLADGRLVRHDRTFPRLGAEAEVRPSLAANVGTVGDVDEEAEGEMMAQLIWHHDTLEYAPWRPLPADPWSSWNLGREPVRGNVVADESWWERYGVEMCTPNVPLNQLATRGDDGVWTLR